MDPAELSSEEEAATDSDAALASSPSGRGAEGGVSEESSGGGVVIGGAVFSSVPDSAALDASADVDSDAEVLSAGNGADAGCSRVSGTLTDWIAFLGSRSWGAVGPNCWVGCRLPLGLK
jgi:hypothetical protein